jgi:hypothetical protein
MLNGNRRVLLYLLVSNFILYFGFQVWQTMFNNYAVEVIGVGPAGIGLIQAVREIPGLLGFLLGVFALYLSEVRIMAVSIVTLGVGMILTGGANGLLLLLVATFVMSTGFHFFDGSSNAVVLMSESKRQTPRTLGIIGSLGSLAAVAASLVVFVLAKPLGYRWLYVAVGGLAIAGVGPFAVPGRQGGSPRGSQNHLATALLALLHPDLSDGQPQAHLHNVRHSVAGDLLLRHGDLLKVGGERQARPEEDAVQHKQREQCRQ